MPKWVEYQLEVYKGKWNKYNANWRGYSTLTYKPTIINQFNLIYSSDKISFCR